jgi:hypothetical protein
MSADQGQPAERPDADRQADAYGQSTQPHDYGQPTQPGTFGQPGPFAQPGTSGPPPAPSGAYGPPGGDPQPGGYPHTAGYPPPAGYAQPSGYPQAAGYPQAGAGLPTDGYGYGNIPASEQFRQQYGQSPAWPGTVAPRGTNSLAIASLCCSIGQVVAGPLSGIPAIVLGAMSLKQIRETGEDGRGMAITGLALGIAGVALTIIAIIGIILLAGSISHPGPPPGTFP